MRLKIGHRRIGVSFVKRIRGGLYGETDRYKDTIKIRTEQSPDQMRETLLHEVLHVCFDVSGLSHELEDDEEETIVRQLSPILLQALQDNPGLVELLTDRGGDQ